MEWCAVLRVQGLRRRREDRPQTNSADLGEADVAGVQQIPGPFAVLPREQPRRIGARGDESAQQLARARRDVSNLRARKNTITNNNICIVNNIYPYSKEPAVVPDSVVQSLLHKPSESVPRFVQLKHFTGPLWARNIHLPNRRGNTVRVIERDDTSGLHWVHRDRKTVLDELFERHVEELRDNYGADSVTKWREWYVSSGLATECPRETTEWKDQLMKLDLLLVNHQNSSLSTAALESL